jgi:hypothetical protein
MKKKWRAPGASYAASRAVKMLDQKCGARRADQVLRVGRSKLVFEKRPNRLFGRTDVMTSANHAKWRDLHMIFRIGMSGNRGYLRCSGLGFQHYYILYMLELYIHFMSDSLKVDLSLKMRRHFDVQ